MDSEKTLLDLDDNCLYHIFSFLNLYDVFGVDKIKNSRIHEIAVMYYKRRASHFARGKFFKYGNFHPWYQEDVFDIIGPYLIHAELDVDADYETGGMLASADRVILPTISEKCRNLRSLRLERLEVVEKRIKECERLYRRLDKLTLYKCVLYEKKDIFGSILSKLNSLSISYSNYVYGHFLLKMENLTTLRLKGCPRIANEHVNKLLTSEIACKIIDLELVNCRDVLKNTLDFSFVKNLESLSLEINQIVLTESTIGDLLHLTKLKKLNLTCTVDNAINIDMFLLKMSEICELEELKLRNFNICVETITSIGFFKKLKTFAGDYLQKENNENVLYSKLLTVLPCDLKCLSLKDGNIADNEIIILSAIKSFPRLERLNLYKSYAEKFMNILRKIVNILKADSYRPPLKLTVHKKSVHRRLQENLDQMNVEQAEFCRTNKSFLAVDVEFEDITDDDDDESLRLSDSDSNNSSGNYSDSRHWLDFNSSMSEASESDRDSNDDIGPFIYVGDVW